MKTTPVTASAKTQPRPAPKAPESESYHSLHSRPWSVAWGGRVIARASSTDLHAFPSKATRAAAAALCRFTVNWKELARAFCLKAPGTLCHRERQAHRRLHRPALPTACEMKVKTALTSSGTDPEHRKLASSQSSRPGVGRRPSRKGSRAADLASQAGRKADCSVPTAQAWLCPWHLHEGIKHLSVHLHTPLSLLGGRVLSIILETDMQADARKQATKLVSKTVPAIQSRSKPTGMPSHEPFPGRLFGIPCNELIVFTVALRGTKAISSGTVVLLTPACREAQCNAACCCNLMHASQRRSQYAMFLSFTIPGLVFA